MNAELNSPIFVFREITYKLKTKILGKNAALPARVTIDLADASISGSGEDIFISAPVKVLLDTEEMFFEAACVFRAKLQGIDGVDFSEKRKYIEDNKSHLGQLSSELMRIEFNRRVNDILSMTMTAPAERVDFWPKDFDASVGKDS